MVKFSIKTTLDLIKLVFEQPNLYDPNGRNFTKIKKRAVIWDEIGANLKKSGEACKKRWIQLKKSYDHFKKGGRVIIQTERSLTNAKFFKKMAFLDLFEKPKDKTRLKQSNGNQQPSNENQQQSNGNQQPSNENQQQSHENNLGSGNPGIPKDFRPESSRADAVSESNNRGQQFAQSSVQLNVNVGSVSYEGIPQLGCENSVVARPATIATSATSKVAQKKKKVNAQKKGTTQKKRIIKRKNNKKACTTPKRRSLNPNCGLDLFCRNVRNILEELPSDLQIKAQTAVFTTLNNFKEMALASSSIQ